MQVQMNSQLRNYLGVWLLASGLLMLIWTTLVAINSAGPGNEMISLKKVSQPKETAETAEEVFTLGRFPDYINLASRDTHQAYEFAANINNHATLKALHCYCGCEDGDNHKSILDCYIKKLLPGDRVVYSNHALSCRTCVTQILETQKYLSEDKSLPEIQELMADKHPSH